MEPVVVNPRPVEDVEEATRHLAGGGDAAPHWLAINTVLMGRSEWRLETSDSGAMFWVFGLPGQSIMTVFAESDGIHVYVRRTDTDCPTVIGAVHLFETLSRLEEVEQQHGMNRWLEGRQILRRAQNRHTALALGVDPAPFAEEL